MTIFKISGVMFNGALLDDGMPLQQFKAEVANLPLRNYDLQTEYIFSMTTVVLLRNSNL